MCFDLCNLTPKGTNLRCSRPLCSSQSTGGTPSCRRVMPTQQSPEETVYNTPKGIITRSLRTQQRAYTSLSNTYLSNPVLTDQAYRVDLSRSCINVNVPPMSATRSVRFCNDWLPYSAVYRRDSTCSLERR